MPKYATAPRRNFSTIVVGVVVVLLVVGLLAVQWLSTQRQDVRNKAASETGQVQVAISGSTTLTPSQPTTLTFTANTSGVQIDGIQLIFDVIGTDLSTPTMSLVTGSGLQVAYNQVEAITGGFRVGLIAIAQPGNTFSSTSPVDIAQLTFTAPATGSVQLTFDNAQSLATVHDSNPPTDELRTIATATYTVSGGNDTSPTPSPDASASPSPSVSPSIAPSPTPSPTPSPGTGGVTLKSCNESCSSNSECKANYGCYNNRCRLSANPGSETCTGPADNGLQRQCNQYCANNGECANGYTCYFNACRRPDNLTSTNCSAPSTTSTSTNTSVSQRQPTTTGRSCNQACTSNRDCAANLRCYQGMCRSNTNPSSPTCAPASATGSTGADKGAEASPAVPPGFGGDSSPAPVFSPTTNNLTPGTALNSPTPREAIDPTDTTADGGSWLTESFMGIPVAVLGLGAAGVAVALIIAGVAWKFFGPKKTSGTGGSGNTKATASAYESQLQAKINALKQPPTPPTSSTMSQPIGVRPPMATTPVAAAPVATPVTTMVPPAPATPPAPPTIEAPPTTLPQPNDQSTMLRRMREKGLNPPPSTPQS